MTALLDPPLKQMHEELEKAPEIVRPSKFWEDLNQKHLEVFDLNTFKRTLARYYFTFTPGFFDPQIHFLHHKVGFSKAALTFARTLFTRKLAGISKKLSLSYLYTTRLLWHYVQKELPEEWLSLKEPDLGLPPKIRFKGRKVTQDIANSLLEVDSITSHVDLNKVQTVLELGAGYGRTAYAFTSLFPGRRYLIADIPPALYVSQSYLTKVFPDKKVFTFRPFSSYAEIQEEFEQADFCFLLPHQLELLPDQSIDLSLNISSLHEMQPTQIAYYLDLFSRLTRHYFYHKQWKISNNHHDGLIIKQEDYPIPSHWAPIFSRSARVQTSMFESLYSCWK